MKAYKKLIMDEENNTITGKGFNQTAHSGVTSQVRKFDNYNHDKVRNLFQQYDNIAVADTDLDKLTIVKTDAITKSAVEFKTKLFITSAIGVVALLAFLVIYNLFVINAMSNGIRILQEGVKSEKNALYGIVSQYDNLPDDEAFKEKLRAEGYSELPTSSVYIDLPETTQYKELTGETNLFDRLCNFVSSLLHGG